MVKDVDKSWKRQSPCRRELDLRVENGEVLQHLLSHCLCAARRVQRHIPVRRAKFWHQADLFGSAPAKDLPEAEARFDVIGESDSVPTRVLEVAIVLTFIVRNALVDVGRACDFEFSKGHMWQVNGSREAPVLCIACHQEGPQPPLEANRQHKDGVQRRKGLNWANCHQHWPLCCSCVFDADLPAPNEDRDRRMSVHRQAHAFSWRVALAKCPACLGGQARRACLQWEE